MASTREKKSKFGVSNIVASTKNRLRNVIQFLNKKRKIILQKKVKKFIKQMST